MLLLVIYSKHFQKPSLYDVGSGSSIRTDPENAIHKAKSILHHPPDPFTSHTQFCLPDIWNCSTAYAYFFHGAFCLPLVLLYFLVDRDRLLPYLL